MKMNSKKVATGSMTFATLLALHTSEASANLSCFSSYDNEIARAVSTAAESSDETTNGIAETILDLFGSPFKVLCGGGGGGSFPPVVACETAPATPSKK